MANRVSVSYQINEPCRNKFEAFLSELLNQAEKLFKVPTNFNVSVVFVGEAEVRRLTARYFGRASVTDVLSFEEVNEIIICYPQAKRQAKAERKSIREEVALLFVHGLLHLLGYDHRSKKQAEKMTKAQAKILGKIPNQALEY